MVKFLEKIITVCFGLIFLAVPLAMTAWNYELFEFNKMLLVYGLTTLVVGSWVLKMILTKTWYFVGTPLDIPLWLFAGSQLVSSVFSIDPHLSWLGYYSRFNGGMWSVICYVLLYHAFVSNLTNLTNKTNWSSLTNLIKLMLVGAVGVSVYGVLQRMGIDKHLWVQDVQNRVFSTLGQPNWLAAYLVALIPLTMAFGARTKNTEHKSQQGKNLIFWSLSSGFWVLISVLYTYVLLNTRSRSGLIGLAVADVVFILFFIWQWFKFKSHPEAKAEGSFANAKTNSDKPRDPSSRSTPGLGMTEITWLTLLIPHLAIFILIFFHGTYIPKIDSWITWKGLTELRTQNSDPNKVIIEERAPLEDTIGISESGDIRRYVWEAAVKTWVSSPKVFFIGTGTETFAYAFFQNKPLGHNLTSEWDFLYNKAHNEYLNYLATTGLAGLLTYLGIIGVFIGWFIKIQISKSKTALNLDNSNLEFISDFGFRISDLVVIALFAGWVSILVTNFFGFSVVVTQLQFFLFPAIILSLSGVGRAISRPFNPALYKYRWQQPVWAAVVVGGIFTSLAFTGQAWYADSLFASGYRSNRSGQPAEAEKYLRRATQLSPMEPLFADELATTLATLTVSAVESGEATRASELARESIRLSGWATSLSPNNTNYWKNRTKVFYAFAVFDQQFISAAIESLNSAYKLSPTDPKIVYNLAILYGRAGDNNKAVETLKYALQLKPNYRDAYFALSVFYTELKKSELAKAILEEYLTKVDPKDVEFLEKIK